MFPYIKKYFLQSYKDDNYFQSHFLLIASFFSLDFLFQ